MCLDVDIKQRFNSLYTVDVLTYIVESIRRLLAKFPKILGQIFGFVTKFMGNSKGSCSNIGDDYKHMYVIIHVPLVGLNNYIKS